VTTGTFPIPVPRESLAIRILNRYANGVLNTLRGLGDRTFFAADMMRALGEPRTYGPEIVKQLKAVGVDSIPLVILVSAFIGSVISFQSRYQLFPGIQLSVVGLITRQSLVLELGPLLTGLVLAGRVGAQMTAEIGTMRVTEQIDALETLAYDPLAYLVVPRVIALVLMMPLLCLFADFVGMLGGAFVGVTMLDVSLTSYYHETVAAVTLLTLFGGLFKATVYGALVALAGCLRGFQCGDDASAVGDAATRAVVSAIVMVVVACGLFAFIFNVLGI